MNDDLNALETILLMDYWPVGRAIYYLVGVDYEDGSYTLLTNQDKYDDCEYFDRLYESAERVKDIWLASIHDDKRRIKTAHLSGKMDHLYDVGYFIQWAQKKRIDIPWLEVAKRHELIIESRHEPKPTRESTKPYQLIAQLIEIILPDHDLSKCDAIHSALNNKLIGENTLKVSPETLKKYLNKI